MEHRSLRLAAGVVVGVTACASASNTTGSNSSDEPPAVAQTAATADPTTTPDDVVGATSSPSAAAGGRALVVSGIFDAEGTELLRVVGATVVDGDARRPAAGTTGIFAVEVVYADGTSDRVPFDALIASDGDVVEHGFFEVEVDLGAADRIEAVRIVSGDGDAVFAEIPRTALAQS